MMPVSQWSRLIDIASEALELKAVVYILEKRIMKQR